MQLSVCKAAVGFFSTFVLASSLANANVIAVDTAFGVGSGTLDTVTNLVWLDLNQSGSFSYNQLLTELQAGGQFDGYQLASAAQLGTFLTDSGILALNGAAAFTAFGQFANLVGGQVHDLSGDGCILIVRGVTNGFNGSEAEVGGFTNTRQICNTPNDPASVNAKSLPEPLPGFSFNDPINSVPFPPHTGGAWLVRAAIVPVPNTASLFALGLAAFGMSGFRRKS